MVSDSTGFGTIVLLCTVGMALPACPLAAPGQRTMPEVIDPVDVSGWVTQLWEPLETVGGDLTGNGLEDLVVALHRRDAIPGDDQVPVGSRGLAIFLLSPNGRYRRVVLAEKLLPCVTCLGSLSRDSAGVPFEIDITGRKIQVSWISNKDGFASVRLTFAWNRKQRAFGLVRDEVNRAGPLRGGHSRRTRDYEAGIQVDDGVKTSMEPRFIPIETVSAADY